MDRTNIFFIFKKKQKNIFWRAGGSRFCSEFRTHHSRHPQPLPPSPSLPPLPPTHPTPNIEKGAVPEPPVAVGPRRGPQRVRFGGGGGGGGRRPRQLIAGVVRPCCLTTRQVCSYFLGVIPVFCRTVSSHQHLVACFQLLSIMCDIGLRLSFGYSKKIFYTFFIFMKK